jgi:hypothetical protein
LITSHCPHAIALPRRGVLDGHAVLSLAFRRSSWEGPREARAVDDRPDAVDPVYAGRPRGERRQGVG